MVTTTHSDTSSGFDTPSGSNTSPGSVTSSGSNTSSGSDMPPGSDTSTGSGFEVVSKSEGGLARLDSSTSTASSTEGTPLDQQVERNHRELLDRLDGITSSLQSLLARLGTSDSEGLADAQPVGTNATTTAASLAETGSQQQITIDAGNPEPGENVESGDLAEIARLCAQLSTASAQLAQKNDNARMAELIARQEAKIDRLRAMVKELTKEARKRKAATSHKKNSHKKNSHKKLRKINTAQLLQNAAEVYPGDYPEDDELRREITELRDSAPDHLKAEVADLQKQCANKDADAKQLQEEVECLQTQLVSAKGDITYWKAKAENSEDQQEEQEEQEEQAGQAGQEEHKGQAGGSQTKAKGKGKGKWKWKGKGKAGKKPQ